MFDSQLYSYVYPCTPACSLTQQKMAVARVLQDALIRIQLYNGPQQDPYKTSTDKQQLIQLYIKALTINTSGNGSVSLYINIYGVQHTLTNIPVSSCKCAYAVQHSKDYIQVQMSFQKPAVDVQYAAPVSDKGIELSLCCLVVVCCPIILNIAQQSNASASADTSSVPTINNGYNVNVTATQAADGLYIGIEGNAGFGLGTHPLKLIQTADQKAKWDAYYPGLLSINGCTGDVLIQQRGASVKVNVSTTQPQTGTGI